MSRKTLGSCVAALGLGALVLVLAAAPGGAQIPEKVLECNSDIVLSFTTASFVPGATVGVEMEVVNGPSNDILDLPVTQDVTTITYYPDCSTITAGIPPTCTVNPAPQLAFVALTSNTCGTMVNSAVAADGSVTFTFNPSPLTLAAAAVPAGTTTCSIFFNAQVPLTAASGATIDSLAVSGLNNCATAPPLDSVASGTSSLMVVPTLGQVALIALGAILLVGAWLLLRRRPVLAA